MAIVENDKGVKITINPNSAVKIDTSSREQADIFPELTKSKFEVSPEADRKAYKEAAKEAEKSGEFIKFIDGLPFIPFEEKIPGTTENIYYDKYLGLKTKAFDNKMDYIESVIGAPVVNIGLGEKNEANLKDLKPGTKEYKDAVEESIKKDLKNQALAFTLSRYETYPGRKKTFEEAYPDGQYKRTSINFGEDKPEDLEFFKYNKNDKEWKIANPYGRDWAEVGRVAGTVIDEQLAGELIALGTYRVPVWGQLPPVARVFIGNLLGIKVKSMNKLLSGKGEGEFNVEKVSDIDPVSLINNFGDYTNAAMSASLFKLTKEIGAYLVKGGGPGLVEIAPDMAKAADELGLEPLIFGQLVANPLIRRIYTQAGSFINRNEDLVQKQIKELELSLSKFGYSKLEDGVEKPLLDFGELQALNEKLALQVARDMKSFNPKGVIYDDINPELVKSLNKWNNISIKTQKTYVNEAIKNIDDLGAEINIYNFKQVVGKEISNFVGKFQPKDIKVKVDGETIFKTPTKQKTGGVPPEFKEIVDITNKLKTTLNTVDNKGDLDNIKTLVTLRENLHKLTYTSADPKIISAAENMHKAIKNILNPSHGSKQTQIEGISSSMKGGTKFLSSMQILDSHMLGAENVRHMAFMKQALTKGGDIDTFVQQFFRPNGSVKITQLKNILMDGAQTKTDKAAAEETFNILKNGWFSSVVKGSPDESIKLLDDFLVNDPNSLKILLGEGYVSRVAQMKEIINKTEQLNNGIRIQAAKGNQYELFKTLENLSKETTLGTEKKVVTFINDLGGINSKAADGLRYEIIKDILQKSTKTNEKISKKQFTEVIDTRELKKEIRNLQSNENLMKIFDPIQVQALQNYNLYATALSGSVDVGDSLIAGAAAAKFVDKFAIYDTGLSILKYNLVSRLLSNKVTAGILKELDSSSPLAARNMELLSAAIQSLGEDVYDVTFKDDKKTGNILYQHPASTDPSKQAEADTVRISKEEEADAVRISKQAEADALKDSPIVNTSRLNRNVVSPIGAGAGPKVNTMAGGPSTMNRGQQLFGNNPREITFAARGGIMNTMKATQRVV